MPRRRKAAEAASVPEEEMEVVAETPRRSTRARGRSSAAAETPPAAAPQTSTSKAKPKGGRRPTSTTVEVASEPATPVVTKTEPVEKSTSFLMTLHKYQQEALFCDAALKSSDGGLVMTHACVVAAACPFIYHELIDCKPSYFTVETSIPAPLLNHLVDFIYSGKISFSPEEADELMNCADIIGLNLRNARSPETGQPEQMTLCDPNWALNLFQIMRQFQKSGVFCDAELKSAVDGGVFTAHTCVIAASKNILCQELSQTGFFPEEKLNKIVREVA